MAGGRKKRKGCVGAYLYYLTRTWKYGEAQDTNVCLEKYDFVMSNIVLGVQYVRHIIMNSEYHIPWRRKQSELCIQKKPHITVYLR
jgi:hypothetical protein